MTRIRLRNGKPVPAGPVTPVELLFDMVFVFVFTLTVCAIRQAG